MPKTVKLKHTAHAFKADTFERDLEKTREVGETEHTLEELLAIYKKEDLNVYSHNNVLYVEECNIKDIEKGIEELLGRKEFIAWKLQND